MTNNEKNYNSGLGYFVLMLFVLLLFVIATGCTSLKKYNALESDYQRAGETLRNKDAELRRLQILEKDLLYKAKKDTL